MPTGLRYLNLLILIVLLSTPAAFAQSRHPSIEPRVDTILRHMGDYLKAAKEFSFHAIVNYDQVLEGGQKILYGRRAEISVRRPNRLHVVAKGDLQAQRIWYDGETFTMLDFRTNEYSTVDVPPNLDDMLDYMARKYGISSPVADVLYSDPYAILTEFVQTGTYIGQAEVRGVPTHHLAFAQENIDWQVWVEDGPRPVPRKFVITYKKVTGSPQFTGWLLDWDFSPRLADSLFHFIAPPGARQKDIAPVDQ